MQLVAMERGALSPCWRIPFFVHVDEFQTFSSEAFASLLSEARKFAIHSLPRWPIGSRFAKRAVAVIDGLIFLPVDQHLNVPANLATKRLYFRMTSQPLNGHRDPHRLATSCALPRFW
jgi:hypothetical protein